MALHREKFHIDTGPDLQDFDELLYNAARRFVKSELKNKLNQVVTVTTLEEMSIENSCLRIEVLGLEEFDISVITRRLQMTFGPSAEMRLELPADQGVRAYLLIPRTGLPHSSGRFLFDSTTLMLAGLVVLLIVYLWANDNDTFLIRSLKAVYSGVGEFMDSLMFPRNQ